MQRILPIVALVILLTSMVQAQTPGYELTTTPPESGMLAVGTAFVMNVLNAPTGQWIERSARVDAYVIWINPPRPADYYVTLLDSPGSWFILSRETVAAYLNTP